MVKRGHLSRAAWKMSVILVFIFCALWALYGVVPGGAPARGEESVEKVVAVVNGKNILEKDYRRLVQDYMSKSGAGSLDEATQKTLLQNLIRRELILQQPETDEYRKEADIRVRVHEYENGLVLARYLERQVGSEMRVSEDEITVYYKENLDKFAARRAVDARHILLRSEEEAAKVLALIREGGDFAELAKEYSIDIPMAYEGGSMGRIEEGRSLPQLEQALFTLQPGEVSEVVKTQFGFHILTVDQVHNEAHRPLDEVREEIRKVLMREKEGRAFDAMAKRLEKDAQITIFEDRLSSALK